MGRDERLTIARKRLREIVDHVRLLAADANTQNAWMHPCGWTRQEPYEHLKDHRPCYPIAELVSSFDDMWPAWRPVIGSSLSPRAETALDGLADRLRRLGDDAYVDELATLDGEQWEEVRKFARETLERLT